jgi:hypothetical protein
MIHLAILRQVTTSSYAIHAAASSTCIPLEHIPCTKPTNKVTLIKKSNKQRAQCRCDMLRFLHSHGVSTHLPSPFYLVVAHKCFCCMTQDTQLICVQVQHADHALDFISIAPECGNMLCLLVIVQDSCYAHHSHDSSPG